MTSNDNGGEEFGDCIKALLLSRSRARGKRVTNREVAKGTGINEWRISRLLNYSVAPFQDEIKSLAKYLELSPKERERYDAAEEFTFRRLRPKGRMDEHGRRSRSDDITGDKEDFDTDLSVEWTNEGPQISGHGVVISPTEANAFLDRWFEWIDNFIDQEQERRGADEDEVWPGANILATLRACGETYNRIPSEAEMKRGDTELSRKFNLLYAFIQAMHAKAFPI